MFTQKDLYQIESKNIQIDSLKQQIKYFKNGFPYISLHNPATIENKGIYKLNKEEISELNNIFEKDISNNNIIKFVPASGAASRMFRSLFSFIEEYDCSQKAYNNYISDKSFNSVYSFIYRIKDFAFYEDLEKKMFENGIDIKNCIEKNDFNTIINFLLTDKGLNYSSLPKGLLKFHKYSNYARTAFEEHFVEAANYSKNKNNRASIHFTLSTEHIEKFKKLINDVIDKYETNYNTKFDISFSVQKTSTDTIAVDMNNEPFREKDGSLLFRPGGHGALLQNLNDLGGDIIFIKNIDNIVPDRLKHETYIYKKALAAYLSILSDKTHLYLKILEKKEASDELITEISTFASDKLNIFSDSFIGLNKDERMNFLFSKLNRPIRVCGMVKNEGEPGGGPFWVKSKNNEISLQIVESSQINLSEPSQKEIFSKSTHFNPVDLVCGVKDYKGNKFNLLNYTDPDTGFISVKSKDGKDLKALELPGLWNGAMANWITIFVEVPVITFNPVKTINDLLRSEHQ
ncbi:MAG: DUF4301 family protein [Bacteroidetes bacterium]|nr:DUF4301 family protein [Bacteroidota bacterium]